MDEKGFSLFSTVNLYVIRDSNKMILFDDNRISKL